MVDKQVFEHSEEVKKQIASAEKPSSEPGKALNFIVYD